MKRIISVLLLCIVACFGMLAQDAETMKKVQEKYKNMNTLTADVKMTKHNTMVTKDITNAGKFYFKKPSKMLMSFANGADMMLMNGDQFTIVKDGQKNTASSKGNGQLESLSTVLKNFSAGQESEIDLSDIADVDVEKTATTMTMTITPIVTDAKQKRKQMFTSFVVVVDTKKGELKSLRMNEKGQNYTQYDFSNFVVNGEVNDAVFNVK